MGYRTVLHYLALLGLVIRNGDASVTVQTSLGFIVGFESTIQTRGRAFELKTFLGIPYAKPPSGVLRWEKPVPAEPFQEPFNATAFGPACPQFDSPVVPPYQHKSEDCLSLNVYVPSQPADKPDDGHAVMVFIHGGGLETGASLSYVPDNLAVLGNVIVITINYRIGIFGFLSTGDDTIPGNMGLFDQHLALKWVNQNIVAFGGDPSRVTVFGQSAGASGVLFQGLYPGNQGYIQRLISESGVPHMPGAFTTDPKSQFKFVAKFFGCDGNTAMESLTCLRSMNTTAVMDAWKRLLVSAGENIANALYAHFLVVADGMFFQTGALPFEISVKAKTKQIPSVEFFRSLDLVIGYNSHDGAFIASTPGFSSITDINKFLPSRREFTEQLINMPLSFYFGIDVKDSIKSVVISQYTDWSNPMAPETNRDEYTRLWTDIYFGIGANQYAIMHANTSVAGTGDTYLYQFTAAPSLRPIYTATWVRGANHGDELGFVFGFDEVTMKGFNESYTVDGLQKWEWELSDRVIRYWSNFAKTGNPNAPTQTSVAWPQYSMTDQTAMNITAEMSESSRMRFFDAEANDMWMGTIPEIMEISSHIQECGRSSSISGSSIVKPQYWMMGILAFCLFFFV